MKDIAYLCTMKRKLLHIRSLAVITMLLLVRAAVVRVFVTDRFIVRGRSMSPTLVDGEAVYVDKTVYGARIYSNYDFDEPVLKCFRIPGRRRPRCSDVVLFNYPFGRDREKIEFKINYVYIKRCIGCPGDSVSIRGGRYINNHVPGGFPEIQGQDLMRSIPDSLTGYAYGCFPNDPLVTWSVKEFGPVLVPGKGIQVALDPFHAALYRYVIEYETGILPEERDGSIWLDGEPVATYTFRDNYYFMAGDNALDSRDSRYFGFVPEDFIIGLLPGK